MRYRIRDMGCDMKIAPHRNCYSVGPILEEARLAGNTTQACCPSTIAMVYEGLYQTEAAKFWGIGNPKSQPKPTVRFVGIF